MPESSIPRVTGWTNDLYEAREAEEHLVIEAFRGSIKSTKCIAFLAFRIGHCPHLTNLVIGSGDDDASEVAKMVADIISDNPGWKMAFPNIIPNEKGRWGAKSGYDVVDTNIAGVNLENYTEWAQLTQGEGRASTIKGVGYQSKYLPGPHPTGVLLVDDIHNEDNTTSLREQKKVKNIYKGTILPMLEPETWHMVAGTPWNDSDLIAYVKSTGVYRHVFTPACEIDKDGKLINLTWPSKWDIKRLERKRKEVGEIEFARMYLLDLDKTKGLVLSREALKYWPHTELKKFAVNWPVIIGIDYTSTADPLKEKGDYFALAVGRVIPGGQGIVITDGARVKLSQAEAEQLVVSWGLKYPTLMGIYVEAVFSGNEFYNHLLNNAEIRKSGLPILPVRVRGKKGKRYEKEILPLFERSRLYLSDEENPFLNAFKDEWLHWGGDRLADLYTDDTLDAVYCIVGSEIGQSFVSPLVRNQAKITNPTWDTQKKPNPMRGFGRTYG